MALRLGHEKLTGSRSKCPFTIVGRKRRPTQFGVIEPGTTLFAEPVEVSLRQHFVQPAIKGMPRRCRQFAPVPKCFLPFSLLPRAKFRKAGQANNRMPKS